MTAVEVAAEGLHEAAAEPLAPPAGVEESEAPRSTARPRSEGPDDDEGDRRERPHLPRSIKDTIILRKEGETIEQMLRRFKRRCSELKIQSELKAKRYHLTKSEKRRLKSRKARRKRRR
jgi:small subunit ribosomal protein S21